MWASQGKLSVHGRCPSGLSHLDWSIWGARSSKALPFKALSEKFRGSLDRFSNTERAEAQGGVLCRCDHSCVNREQAEEIGGALLQAEPGESDREAAASDFSAIARSLEALLPDLGDEWAVVKMHDLPSDEETTPTLLAIEGDRLWTAWINRAEAKPQWPQVMVWPYERDDWELVSVTDTLHSLSGAGAEQLCRAWHVKLRGGDCTFMTDELVLGESSPCREEQFGRALAAACDWVVRDVAPPPIRR